MHFNTDAENIHFIIFEGIFALRHALHVQKTFED